MPKNSMRKHLQFKSKNSDLVIDYFLEQKSIKNLYMKINRNKQIIVSAPYFLAQTTIDTFISKNIEKLFQISQEEKHSTINLEEKYFYLFGKKIFFEIDQLNQKIIINDIYPISIKFKKNLIEIALEEYLKKELKTYLIQSQLKWEKIMQITHHHLEVRQKEKAWATNYVKNKKIFYSTKLIPFAKEIIDYVIIHELTHHHEPNHSKNFWKIVQQFDPNFKTNRAKLKKHQYL